MCLVVLSGCDTQSGRRFLDFINVCYRKHCSLPCAGYIFLPAALPSTVAMSRAILLCMVVRVALGVTVDVPLTCLNVQRLLIKRQTRTAHHQSGTSRTVPAIQAACCSAVGAAAHSRCVCSFCIMLFTMSCLPESPGAGKANRPATEVLELLTEGAFKASQCWCHAVDTGQSLSSTLAFAGCIAKAAKAACGVQPSHIFSKIQSTPSNVRTDSGDCLTGSMPLLPTICHAKNGLACWY